MSFLSDSDTSFRSIPSSAPVIVEQEALERGKPTGRNKGI
ncbi:hypothetical protein EYZ11_004476 [Aspergillus tanneri]|uniref:Uncharacterized protein n=1 Tax=Aspergillus tanneri TaxID=1220188 RepID=A0A4S3JKY5_9EURO|nr:hypothetical protein EYZ11_004476 [Aspergillus tanneri]